MCALYKSSSLEQSLTKMWQNPTQMQASNPAFPEADRYREWENARGGQENVEVPEEVFREITEFEKEVYASIYDELYMEAINEPVPTSSELEEKRSCCEQCIAICSHSFKRKPQEFIENQQKRSGTFPNVLKLRTSEIMTPVLRRGRTKGWGMFAKVAFPLVNDVVRDVWIITELLTVLVAFALSGASFSLGNNEAFNILHLVLTIISTILACIDAIVNLSQCRSCKQCYKQSQGGGGNVNVSGVQNAPNTGTCCGECIDRCKTASDFIRMIATELILYPLLLCDMFELITEKAYNVKDPKGGIGFVLLIISSLSLILYVYVLRLVVLGYLIKYVQKERKPPVADPARLQQLSYQTGYDETISKDALWFQSYFFFHVLGQMASQILVLIAIGAKIQYDNRDADESFNVSGYLWFMMVSGYILPVCGTLTFFIVTYYWVQQFPIGICLDLLSILQMPDANHIFYPNQSTKEIRDKVNAIMNFFRYNDLKNDFTNMHKTASWLGDKFTYPFRSPLMVALAITYSAFQFAFILCAALTDGMEVEVLNGGLGWVLFYIFSIIVGVVANLYVFIVAALWTFIIVSIIVGIAVIVAFIVLIIALVILYCFLKACSSNSDGHVRN